MLSVLGSLVTVLLLILLLLAFGGACLVAASGIANEGKKHEAFISIDNSLPLRGRWLRYVAAAALVALGILFILCAAYVGRYLVSPV